GTYQTFGYDAYGNRLWEEDELYKHTSYFYDNYNRLLTVTRPLNEISNYTYTPTYGTGGSYSHTTNNPDKITVRTSNTSNIVTQNVYDENFLKTQSTAAYGTSQAATTWFNYDA